MGCSDSKNAITPEIQPSGALNAMSQEAKSRLEWKMCQSKETPEPHFDLSECSLTRIPSGVFVVCKVLRKEILDLSQNQLNSLHSGGDLDDLTLLRSLNLNFNKFTKLPDDIHKIENLRELFISNNKLDQLPTDINRLNHLEHLDVSNNKLKQIREINCMPNLKLLNLCGNIDLHFLPYELTTCDSLTELIFDHDCVQYPPSHIITQSTTEIIKYLLTNERADTGDYVEQSVKDNRIKSNDSRPNVGANMIREHKPRQFFNQKQQATQTFIEQEIKSNELLQRKLHEEQQKRKEEFLQQLLQQQGENDTLAQKLQDDSDIKRAKLIENINKEEENASNLVSYWLSSKRDLDPVLLEKERQEHEQLISELHLKNSDLRRQEIMLEMVQVLQLEANFVHDYNQKRDDNSRKVVEKESLTNTQLDAIFKSRGLENSTAIVNMLENEKVQKRAVEALIERNDSRSWGLIEQVRIIESQLATITQCEIVRKQLSADESLVDICAERSKLTAVLLDLLQQQSERKEELLNSIKFIELQKDDQQEDFWLLQYQKLIDSQPKNLAYSSCNIDPQLGYQFLINGVIHYIPLLANVFQQCDGIYLKITDDKLLSAGIKNVNDRAEILKSINDYYQQQSKLFPVSAPQLSTAVIVPGTSAAAGTSAAPATTNEDDLIAENGNECVICMEKASQTIFIPCGHLCCCFDCQTEVTLCPMCRATIEQRIKVIPV